MIVHVISTLAGGPARVLTQVATKGPHKSTIIVLTKEYEEKDVFSELNSKGHEVVFFSRKKKIDLYLYFKVRKTILGLRPEGLYSYDFTSGIICGLSIFGTRIKWFPGIHGLITVFERWRANLLWILFFRANMVIVPSEALKRKLIEYKLLKSSKITVIPNGIKTNGPIRNSKPPVDHFRLVCVGNFYSKIKGQNFAVEAMNLLPNTYFLTLIGDGKEINGVKDIVRHYHLEKSVKFLGRMTNHQIRQELVEHDLLLIPSLSEAFGLSAVEGFATGLPVIASNVGGLPEVVNEDCGIVVPPASPHCLAQAIQLVCGNPILWTKMHYQAKKIAVENYDAALMSQRYHQIISSVQR